MPAPRIEGGIEILCTNKRSVCRRAHERRNGEILMDRSIHTRWIGAVLLVIAFLTTPVASYAGLSVQNGRVVDGNGSQFVIRGVNYPFVWYTSRYPSSTQQDFANMAATKANAVRIVLGTGAQYTRTTGSQLTNLIQWSKNNKMIAILEVHDSTGYGDSGAPNAVHITNAVSYWQSSDVKSALQGQEDYVIINIANEPFGNNSSGSAVNDTANAIRSLRNAGFTHMLMVDAANWGQDWSGTTKNSASTIFNADTRRNTVISVHMYEVYQDSTTISNYMQAYQSAGVPLVVGEFGADHQGAAVDEGSIMAQAQQRGVGYIGWSWSGNGSCCTSLDIVSSFSTSLTSWGNILVNGGNGLKATASPASIFAGTSSLNVSTGSLSYSAGSGSASISVTSNVNWSASDNSSWITVSPTSGSNNGSVSVSVTANTASNNRTGTVTISGGGISRTVSVTQNGTSSTVGTIALTAAPGNGQITLNWSFSNVTAGNQEVYRDTDSNPSGRTRIAQLNSSARSYTATGLSNGTTYYFWVKNIAGSVTTDSSAVSGTPSGGGSTCNWYGTTFPYCSVDNGGWGWENNQSCISRSLCASQ
jgi:mannan endo-1,4-beta-mannosidase